ncbi:WD40 repeat domain-containing protein [Streptomyces sp. NPDC057638]|uniref:WD40 repeat domain-containing protein n=1 Tax=Streptomyces sp. NPDC057638 TaxID=3346190 RepID=UPI00368D4D7B
MRSYPYVIGAAALVLFGATPATADEGGFTLEDPRITESSGLAASRTHPGVYWTHNDQDQPRVFAVDAKSGKTVATVTFRGIGEPRDMEAISIGPDGRLYVGDIGDNKNGTWPHVWIYAFPEPKELRDMTVRATQYTVMYADGPRNAESLMIHPVTGRAYIASKEEEGGGLYEGPQKLSATGKNTFRKIGDVPWVTDGAFSPNGHDLVLRSYFSARRYEWKDGRLGADHRVRGPLQPQSESVTYTTDGSAVMFGTEGERSEVKRVEVQGSGPKTDAKRASGASASPGEEDGDRSTLTGGVVLLGLAGLAVLWLARKSRSRG